jgi:hypothetical protein
MMTYQERRTIDEFRANAEKTAETQPAQTVEHIKNLCAYVDQLGKEARR